MQNSGATSPISSLVPISFSLNHKSSISVTLHMPMLCTLSKILKTISSGTGCQIGHALLKLIHCVNTPEPSAPISVKDGIGQPDAKKLDNQVSSKSSRGGKERVKKGPSNQCCGTCGTLGHNSKFRQQVSVPID